MAKNDFKAFATGENANTLSQEEYESLGFIEEGFKSGIARSEQLNKVWRQSSIIAAVIGKYIAEKTGEDVIDDGDLEKLVAQLDLALKQKITAEIPDASLARKGISQLNNATNSDREDQAATPKAVNDVRKMAEGKLSSVADATLSQKGIVQLSSATDSANETLAATPRAVKGAYDFANTANVAAKNAHDEANRATDNANSRLAKNQNGVDIPNKSEFIKNLGLSETVALAKSAYSKSGGVVNGNVDATGYISGKGVYEAPGIRVYSQLNKPTAGDVGAYPKTGGVVNGSINATGSIYGNGVYDAGVRVYSATNKPSPEELGAAPLSWVNNNFARGNVEIVETISSYPRIYFKPPADKKNRGYFGIEASLHDDNYQSIYLYKRKASGENIFVTSFPQKYGTLATIDDINAANNIPVGVPLPWPQPNPPSGYLACNGQAFNKSTYPKLATAYPSGRVPDLRGEFIRGWDDGRGVDSGRGILSYQEGQAPVSAIAGYWDNNWNNGKHRDTGFSAATGTNNGSYHEIIQEYENQRETRPRNIAFNYIVRAA
ncbi:phage tail protein [Photorhabdus tasmaniensis]